MSSSFEASSFLLLSVAIVFGIVSLLSILGNKHTRSSRKSFVYAVAAFAIIYLLRLLSNASISVGTNNRRSNKSIRRLECLYSNKGGKRPFGDTGDEYRNPCYNSSLGYEHRVNEIEPYISAARDCHQAQRKHCSLSQPCTPCELSRRDEFHNSDSSRHDDGWSRCQACSVRNGNGDCNFVVGVGPYCWKNAERLEVVPCETCCTERYVAMFDAEGACY